MQTFKLKSQNPVPQVDLHVNLEVQDSRLLLEYHLKDPENNILLEDFSQDPQQRDGLWEETCFEFFGTFSDDSYEEYNFSPAGHWQAYLFQSYRQIHPGKSPTSSPISIERIDHDKGTTISLNLPLKEYSLFNLSAVLLTQNRDKAYYSLKPQNKPDFHLHRDYSNFSSFD